MANCYANLITLKGNNEQIKNAFNVLGEKFDLSGYWKKHRVYNNDNYRVIRMNDVGVLIEKEARMLKYYLWTKWNCFQNDLAICMNYKYEEKHDILFPNGIDSFNEWIGIDNIEIIYYPAEYFEEPTYGIEKHEPELFIYEGMYENQIDWEIDWHRFSYAYILEFELKLNHLMMFSRSSFVSLIKQIQEIDINKDLKRKHLILENKFSDFVSNKVFVNHNKNQLLNMIRSAKSRIKRPPFSNHHGNGQVESIEEINAFSSKYSLT